jgi:hypothetical protein
MGMNKSVYFLIGLISLVYFLNCDKSTPLQQETPSLFATIEHAAIHMQDGSGLAVAADTTMPGPHLEPDSIEHRRIDVTLPAMGNGYGGYIHFGPDVSGDMLVCADIETDISFTNRTAQGDLPLQIERSFSSQEILDSAGTAFIKKAVLFEAHEGANIIKIGPVAQSAIHLVIEEAAHEHLE